MKRPTIVVAEAPKLTDEGIHFIRFDERPMNPPFSAVKAREVLWVYPWSAVTGVHEGADGQIYIFVAAREQ